MPTIAVGDIHGNIGALDDLLAQLEAEVVEGDTGHWGNARLSAAAWPEPAVLGRTIGIDTSPQGVVTAVRLPDLRVFQSGRARSWTLGAGETNER